MNDIIKMILPTLATALGGPLAGVAVNWIASKLGVEATSESVTNALSGMSADQLVAMKQMDIDFAKHMADNGIALDLANIKVNEQEAKHESIFVSGGRPFCIWVGGVSFAYVGIIEPLIRFAAKVGFGYEGEFPEIDGNLTLTILGGLLGLGGMRTYEMVKGARK